MMKRFKLALIILPLIFFMMPTYASEKVQVYLFYSDTCPHCAHEIEYLEKTYAQDKQVELNYYELSELENYHLFTLAQEVLDTPALGVPYLVIGSDVIVGFMQGMSDVEIDERIQYYQTNAYHDPLANLLAGQETPQLNQKDEINKTFNVPLLGKVEASSVSLPLLASVMGLVDGFNPCAMWVLIFLISMMLQLQDRKKMWLLGFTFIFTSGFIYYLFMFAWLNVATILSKISLIQIVISLFAILFGVNSIYKFVKNFNQDGCEIIDDKRRHKITTKVKAITQKQSLIVSLLSIVSLAVLVNLFELMCSLGLPVVFTQILNANQLSPLQTQAYLLLYLAFFLLDDLVIFIIAMKTLKIKAISARYAKYAQLIGGLIMVVLGLLMAFKPEWLMLNFM